jgi:hypothetical protein
MTPEAAAGAVQSAVVRALLARFDVQDERILRGNVDRADHLGDFRFLRARPLDEDQHDARGLSHSEEVVKMAYEHRSSPIGGSRGRNVITLCRAELPFCIVRTTVPEPHLCVISAVAAACDVSSSRRVRSDDASNALNRHPSCHARDRAQGPRQYACHQDSPPPSLRLYALFM